MQCRDIMAPVFRRDDRRPMRTLRVHSRYARPVTPVMAVWINGHCHPMGSASGFLIRPPAGGSRSVPELVESAE